MDEGLLEIREYTGDGYQPLVAYENWRVAVLRYLDALHPDRNHSMERHMDTDEVWVLLQGRGVLILGGNAEQVDDLHPQTLEAGKIYNVKRFAWHTALLSRDATVLLVENNNTGDHNTEFIRIPLELHPLIKELAQRGSFK